MSLTDSFPKDEPNLTGIHRNYPPHIKLVSQKRRYGINAIPAYVWLPVILKVAFPRNNSSNVHAAITISIFTFNSMVNCTTNSCLSRCVDIRIGTKILKKRQEKISCSLKTTLIIENILIWNKKDLTSSSKGYCPRRRLLHFAVSPFVSKIIHVQKRDKKHEKR